MPPKKQSTIPLTRHSFHPHTPLHVKQVKEVIDDDVFNANRRVYNTERRQFIDLMPDKSIQPRVSVPLRSLFPFISAGDKLYNQIMSFIFQVNNLTIEEDINTLKWSELFEAFGQFKTTTDTSILEHPVYITSPKVSVVIDRIIDKFIELVQNIRDFFENHMGDSDFSKVNYVFATQLQQMEQYFLELQYKMQTSNKFIEQNPNGIYEEETDTFDDVTDAGTVASGGNDSDNDSNDGNDGNDGSGGNGGNDVNTSSISWGITPSTPTGNNRMSSNDTGAFQTLQANSGLLDRDAYLSYSPQMGLVNPAYFVIHGLDSNEIEAYIQSAIKAGVSLQEIERKLNFLSDINDEDTKQLGIQAFVRNQGRGTVTQSELDDLRREYQAYAQQLADQRNEEQRREEEALRQQQLQFLQQSVVSNQPINQHGIPLVSQTASTVGSSQLAPIKRRKGQRVTARDSYARTSDTFNPDGTPEPKKKGGGRRSSMHVSLVPQQPDIDRDFDQQGTLFDNDYYKFKENLLATKGPSNVQKYNRWKNQYVKTHSKSQYNALIAKAISDPFDQEIGNRILSLGIQDPYVY